jgi:hypothetical protein
VDKTRYIPKLESAGNFLFLIRPRRFGKSSLLTVLECYYDIARQDQFDFLFQDTYIAQHPTPEKHAYLILKFNFSQINPDMDKVEASFKEHTDTCFFFFGEKYREFLDETYFSIMEQKESAHGKLEFLLRYIGAKGRKVYVLIDEYDNFANTVLSTTGSVAYHELTHGAGFFRFFFNVLKGAVDQVDPGIGRMFITGVSPVTMDDVTSGFNIGQNVSLYPEFNALLGFTEQDVRGILQYYDIPMEQTLTLMHEWYDHYRFSNQAEQGLFNTDMVLYFVKHFLRTDAPPATMIDQNVRIDYGKLRHLIVLDRRLNGNFSYLREILEKGGILLKVTDSFPVERLTEPSNFVSLLFYFGLLSYGEDGALAVPNQTVKQLMYGYIRAGYEDVDVFNLDLLAFSRLMRDMAYTGEWRPVFEFLAEAVAEQTSIRDYLTGEKVIQTFLLAYLNVTDYYLTRSEQEMGKGFADLYLEPFWPKHRDVAYSYLIELKYIPRGVFSEQMLQDKLAEAATQLQQYTDDPRLRHSVNLTCVALVFSGWELKAAEAF